MTETLPYLNIFPTNDLDEDGSIQENLPSSEGINEVSTEESGEGQGELVEETEKQYETDEYVPDDGGAGSGVPDAVPKDPSGSEEPPMDTGRTQPVRTSAPSSQGQDDQGGQDAARDSTAAGTEKTQ
jgi:stage V sporulation protein D (sporulation-specific penicillin-binding protein)